MKPARRITIAMASVLGAVAMLALPGAAAAKDRNHDRIPDRWEKRHHLSTRVNQAHRDQDTDHLRNRAEFLAGDNPRDEDSDDDGVMDGDENAGTIQSFDAKSGRLTITLFGGGETVSGLIDEGTEIECPHGGEESVTASASHEGEDGQPEGGEDPGDDHGDRSGPGEDHGDCHEGGCTTADLIPGATVEEADLRLADGVATFEKVELGS